MKRNAPNLLLLEYRNGPEERQVATEENKGVSAAPIVMPSAQRMKSTGSAMEKGICCRVTETGGTDSALSSIKGATDNHELEQQIELLRKLLGERASLYELIGSWHDIKKLVSIFV